MDRASIDSQGSRISHCTKSGNAAFAPRTSRGVSGFALVSAKSAQRGSSQDGYPGGPEKLVRLSKPWKIMRLSALGRFKKLWWNETCVRGFF